MSYSPSASWSDPNALDRSISLPASGPLQPEKLSNYDLVLRCQDGLRPERDAFAELMRRYQSHVEKVLPVSSVRTSQ